MKEDLAIIVFPDAPLFSITEEIAFPSMNTDFSSILYQAMYLNHLEFFKENNVAGRFYFLLYESDRNNITETFKEFFGTVLPVFLHNPGDSAELHNYIAKIGEKFSSMLIFRSNSLGLSRSLLDSYINMLEMDNNVLLLSHSSSEHVVAYGLNHFDSELKLEFGTKQVLFTECLKKVSVLDRFLFVSKELHSLNTLEDFRTLYSLLSQKENYNLCSLRVHDMLTDVFIEYREILK